jgi:hypothetical protein
VKAASILTIALIGLALPAGAAHAGCFPVKSEVVSLGEKSARFYAERSLVKSIDDQKGSVESSGSPVGRVTRGALDCKPFPNLIGADEWRCTGEAKVCTGTDSGKADAGSARKVAAKQKKKARSAANATAPKN